MLRSFGAIVGGHRCPESIAKYKVKRTSSQLHTLGQTCGHLETTCTYLTCIWCRKPPRQRKILLFHKVFNDFARHGETIWAYLRGATFQVLLHRYGYQYFRVTPTHAKAFKIITNPMENMYFWLSGRKLTSEIIKIGAGGLKMITR